MLSTAKIPLEMKLQQILYDAYMSQYNADPSLNSCDGEAKKAIEKAALKFSQKAAGPTATAIYNFVKEIGIMVSIPPSVVAPPLPPTLPGGPCTGVIPLTNITIM
jgi:hypothetical protein